MNENVVFTGPILCKQCSTTVVWARSRSGKNILMDFRPSPLGEFCIVGVDHPYQIVAKLTNPPSGAKRYMCHFDTCTNRRRRPSYRRTLNAQQKDFKKAWDNKAYQAARTNKNAAPIAKPYKRRHTNAYLKGNS